eukprot:8720812-Ditylum_brightwellii.AAC.1
MDILELDKEYCSCVCCGGDIVKDVVEAAAAMSAVVATALLGTFTTTGVLANTDRALKDICFTEAMGLNNVYLVDFDGALK